MTEKETGEWVVLGLILFLIILITIKTTTMVATKQHNQYVFQVLLSQGCKPIQVILAGEPDSYRKTCQMPDGRLFSIP